MQIPESVKKDTLGYREKVNEFLKGKTSPAEFRAYRVPMGIYEQRNAGKYMVRIRIGAGILTSQQGRKIARLSKRYGNGIIHVTTRQDIQIHAVDIEHTCDILEQLLKVDLSTRGGGGNTVRNVTACSRCGVCPQEVFNVGPYAIATAEYLLQNKDSFNLPRKYKIVFSGCSEDCSLASVADLGFFAKKRNGTMGFSVYAAGGLGSSPNVAIRIEDFIEAKDVFLVAETIRKLFDEHGDRTNRNRARLRYVLKRLGEGEFIQLYKSYKEKVIEQGLLGQIPVIREMPLFSEQKRPNEDRVLLNIKSGILKEKQDGLFSVNLNLQLGDIPAGDLLVVADISEKYGNSIIRTSQLQNLIITSVPADNLKNVDNVLGNLSIDISGRAKNNIVPCTGASTCKLGFCLSRGLASAISDKLNENGISIHGTVIRISGCPNSCAQHHIAEIGLQGRAKRVNDRLMPCYDILAGGATVEGKAKLAEKIATVPAKSIPDALAKVFENKSTEIRQLKEVLSDYENFSAEFPDEYFYDYGAKEPFTLLTKGSVKGK